jgi:hypothetical protein
MAISGAFAILCAALATIAAAVLTRIRGAYAIIVIALYVAAGYAATLRRDPPHRFGALMTPAPGREIVDTFTARRALTYRVNEHGFRAPGWPLEKAPGRKRVALIGDSYVFGIGVDQGETLAERLAEALERRRPGRRVEVLNLGIPGDNISSHVDLYAEAVARLAPDVIVLCLTLPNDLSRWDIQDEQREGRRVGGLSLSTFLLGHAAITLYDYALLEQRVTPAGLAHLSAELGRLDGARRAAPAPPATAVYAFGRPDPTVLEVIARLREIPFVAGGDPAPDDFIPGDGHPTAKGNLRSAEWIADGLEGASML